MQTRDKYAIISFGKPFLSWAVIIVTTCFHHFQPQFPIKFQQKSRLPLFISHTRPLQSYCLMFVCDTYIDIPCGHFKHTFIFFFTLLICAIDLQYPWRLSFPSFRHTSISPNVINCLQAWTTPVAFINFEIRKFRQLLRTKV